MAELPASWKLKPVKRHDGRTDIVGTDDTGAPYVARTTEQDGVTESDVQFLAENNRETNTASEVVRRHLAMKEKHWKDYEDRMLADFMEPAEMAAFAGTEKYSRTICFSHIPQKKWDAIWSE